MPISFVEKCEKLQMLLSFFFQQKVGWLVVLGLTALSDSISVYIGPSLREGERQERKDRGG